MKSDEEGSIPLRFVALVIILILSIVIALMPTQTVSYTAQVVEAQEPIEAPKVKVEPEPQVQPAQEKVNPKTKQLLQYISYCESRHNQFNDDGTVLRNSEGSSALGQYQIMESVWSERAKELDYDIYTQEGNEAMAKQILLHDQGIGAWEASNDCFNKNFGFIITNNKIVWTK